MNIMANTEKSTAPAKKAAARPRKTKAEREAAARARDERDASKKLAKAQDRLDKATAAIGETRAAAEAAERELLAAQAAHDYASSNPALPQVDPTVQPGSNPPAEQQ